MGFFSDSSGYIVEPVGGQKWLYESVNESFNELIHLKSWFMQETNELFRN